MRIHKDVMSVLVLNSPDSETIVQICDTFCPVKFCVSLGLGWDRVNFHRKLREHTARTADPN